MTACLADPTIPADDCYFCRNEVAPSQIAGTWGLARQFPVEVLDAERARRRAVGQDPSLAAVALRLRANQAVAA